MPANNQDSELPAEQARASRTPTLSSQTHVSAPVTTDPDVDATEKEKDANVPRGGEGESAFPEDKKVRDLIRQGLGSCRSLFVTRCGRAGV